MGVNRLFWPQELLDEWVVEEKALIEGELLTLRGERGRFNLRQAVLFVADVGDGSDPHGLVGRVKESMVLEEMHAEQYMDSVLIGDSAYEVAPGFTGELLVDVRSDGRGDDITGAVATRTGTAGEAGDDRELLARFLLDNL